MKVIKSIAASMLLVTGVAAAEPAEKDVSRVAVEWQSPEDFTDMKATNGHRKRFRENTMNKFENYLEDLAEDLPAGQQLKMVVTDVDLAGRVWPGHFVGFNNASDVRVVKRIDIPRINFSYELMDETGATIKSGEMKLKDMGFQDSQVARNDHDSLRYEKRMLKRWFKKEFGDQLVAMN